VARKGIKCPQCGRELTYESISDVPTFPFCSVRCKYVDLDKWFDGEYRICEDASDATETPANEDFRRDGGGTDSASPGEKS